MTLPIGWSTENEISYINFLAAGGTEEQRRRGVSVELLLTNYVKSAEKRRKWGTFGTANAGKIIKHARGLL